jgi:hypothetical protein
MISIRSKSMKKALPLALLAALSSASAYADLEIIGPQSKQPPSVPPAAESGASGSGQAAPVSTDAVQAIATPVRPPISFGNQVPLAMALNTLVPKSWGIQLPPELMESNERVSWSGGQTWQATIEQALRSIKGSSPYFAIFDTVNQRVVVSQFARQGKDGNTIYVAPSGKTMSAVIKHWASIHDWNDAWEVEADFIINGHAEFQNNLAGAIDQLIQAVPAAQQLLIAEVYSGNRMILVQKRKGASL